MSSGFPGWASLFLFAKTPLKSIASCVAEIQLQCMHLMEASQDLEGGLRPTASKILVRLQKEATETFHLVLAAGSRHMVDVVMPCLSRRPVLRNLWALKATTLQSGSIGMSWSRRGGNECRPGSLGSIFPSGTKAEKEGTREKAPVIESSCLPVLQPRRGLVREEAGKGLP